MKREDIKKIAKLTDKFLDIGPDIFRSLIRFANRMHWQVIEYNDGGTGDQFIMHMGLKASAVKYNAFLYTDAGRSIILLNSKHPHKNENLGHEIGHILLEHDYGNLTQKCEDEADEFAEYIVNLIKHKPKKHKYIKFALIGMVILSIGLLVAFILKPTQASISKDYTPASTLEMSILEN